MFRQLGCGVLVATVAMLVFAGSAAIAADPKPPTEQEARAAAHVRQALEMGLLGDVDARRKHLDLALHEVPAFAPAHWHSGHVDFGGSWMSAEAAVRASEHDADSAEYRILRDKCLSDPEREPSLARWCARQRLHDQADLHYARLLIAEGTSPRVRNEAMRHLKLRNVGGQLVAEEDLEAYRERADQVRRAIQRWQRRLQTWQTAIDSGRDRESALASLSEIDDPEVIPAIATVFAASGAASAEALVHVLARFPDHEATQLLAVISIQASNPDLREQAARELKQRPLHDFVPFLLSALVAPVSTRWHVTQAPNGSFVYEHYFFRDGPLEDSFFRTQHVAQPKAVYTEPAINRLPEEGERLRRARTTHEYGPAEILKGAELVQAARQREILLAAENEQIQERNQPVFDTLEQISGRFPPRDPAAWWDWWHEYNHVYFERPTRYGYQNSSSCFTRLYRNHYEAVPIRTASCFVAGTPVWTLRGKLPIETIQIGDQVLSQDVETGELAYKLVLQTTLRPPGDLTRVSVEGEQITTTKGHPFWVARRGWRMSTLVEAEDRLHTMKGLLPVKRVQDLGLAEPAHNLVVADFATYFVGDCGILVHDNTYREPTQALVPGLLPD